MHRILIALAGALVMLHSAAALAQRAPRHDPIGDNMIPPELLMRHQQELGLTEQQVQSIREQLETMQAQFPDLQKNLQKEMEALGQLLGQEKPDSEKSLAQLDKVLDAERAIKRAQLSLMLEIKSKLTPDQLAKAGELRKKMMEEARNRVPPPESFRTKIQQMQEKLRSARENGQDLSAVRPLMEELQPLMQEQKYKEAEEVVDRILKAMEKP